MKILDNISETGYDTILFKKCSTYFDTWFIYRDIYQTLREKIYYGIAIPFIRGTRAQDFYRALGDDKKA